MSFRMNTKKRLLLALAGCLFWSAWAVCAAPAKKDIVISLDRKEIRQMDGSGLILVFFLQIVNSERSAYSLAEYDYRVVVQDTDYFALRTALEEPIAVAGESTTRISLPIRVTYTDLLERVPAAAGGTKVQCYVIGQMVFADSRGRQEKIPFAFSGEFPIFRPLEVEIRPLEVQTLTVGGAIFNVVFSCRNGNDFEMILGKLSYQLDLEGRTIASGIIPAGKRVEGGGELTLSMPHMLEFFEVGREVFETMQKPFAPGELRIETQAESIWGDIEVNSGQKGEVQIQRTQ
jgi:LEA14-like dessication related protein